MIERFTYAMAYCEQAVFVLLAKNQNILTESLLFHSYNEFINER